MTGMQTDGIQPMVTLDDCLEAEDICKADRGFQQLMRDRYDITDMATLACDPWYYGGRYRKRLSTTALSHCPKSKWSCTCLHCIHAYFFFALFHCLKWLHACNASYLQRVLT